MMEPVADDGWTSQENRSKHTTISVTLEKPKSKNVYLFVILWNRKNAFLA